jgi:hypothetical protein
MSKAVKSKIYKLVEQIEDIAALNQLKEDASFYAAKKDVAEELTPEQLLELDKAIKEADGGETISFETFKKEMKKWQRK